MIVKILFGREAKPKTLTFLQGVNIQNITIEMVLLFLKKLPLSRFCRKEIMLKATST
jgi:hypothetical protein